MTVRTKDSVYDVKDLYVYKFKFSFYGPYQKEEGKCKYYQHSGKILAKNTLDVYMRLLKEFSEFYDDEKDEDDDSTFDFENISIKEYTDIENSLIIWDKGDDYFGI